MLLAVIVVSIAPVVVAIKQPSCYGGGDIKFMAACAFVLGTPRAVIALVVGLIVGIGVTIIKRKLKHQPLREQFPMVPGLALGTALSYFLI